MQKVTVLSLLLILPYSSAHAAEECTLDWALQVVRDQAGKETNAKGGDGTTDALGVATAKCPNAAALLLEVAKRIKPKAEAVAPAEAATPAASVAPGPVVKPRKKRLHGGGGGTGKNERPRQPVAAAGKKVPSPSPQSPGAPKEPVEPATTADGKPSEAEPVSPQDYLRVLRVLQQKLVADMVVLQRDCKGFAECSRESLGAWLATFVGYLSLVQTPEAPEEALRAAGALISRVAAESPEAGMAAHIATALEKMSEAQKKKLRGQYRELRQAIDAKTVADRLQALLARPEKIPALFSEVAVGANRVAVAGRGVVTSLDLAGLGDACAGELASLVRSSFRANRRQGILLYDAKAAGAAAHDVGLVAGIVDGTAAGCGGEPGSHCIKIEVTTYFDPEATAPPPRTFHSRPYTGCPPETTVLDDLAKDSFSSFAVELAADNTSVTSARLIRAGCIEVVAKDEAKSAKRLAPLWRKTGHTIELGDDDPAWPDFKQELDDAMASSRRILGDQVANVPVESSDRISLSWRAGKAVGDTPSEVRLELHLPGAQATPEPSLRLVPKGGADCAFSALSFKQAAATQAALWLMRLTVPPVPQQVEKNWALSPLGLVLAGLPQLLDQDPDNDLRGGVLAVTDAVLLATTAILFRSSLDARRDYSLTQDPAALDRANWRLHAGHWAVAGVLATRVVSILW